MIPVSAPSHAESRRELEQPRRASLLTSGGALVAAKIVFVIAGYAIYAGLSRLLTPAQFGTFLVVNSTVAVLNAVFVTGTIQAVSRFVAQSPESAAGTLRTALRLQLALAGPTAGAYFLAAPLLASALNDAQLTPYLRVSAVIPLAYAFYAAMIGYANGLRHFGRQAAFDMSFSGIKIALVIVLPWLGFGALGAVAGFSLASVVILTASWVVIGMPALRHSAEGPSPSTLLRYELTVMGHVGLTNLLMQIDLLMVKALVSGDANAAAAMYGSAAKLAQIPYSVLVALNFLIFPYIARSTAQSPTAETAGYIRHALRIGAALTLGPAVVLAVISPAAISLVFGASYVGAAPVLEMLAFGFVAFSLLTLASTIVNGSGRPGVSLAIATATVLMQIGLARLLVPSDGILGGAIASAAAYTFGLGLAMTYLIMKFGRVLPWASFGRILVAAAVVAMASRTGWPQLPVVLTAPLLGAMYLGMLVLLREWSAADIRSAVGRRE